MTPTVGDDFYCKGESYTCFGPDLCNGCLSVNDFGNLEAILKCCDTRKVGGNADILLDWLLTEILTYVSEIVLPGQVLTEDITTYSLWRNGRNGRNRMTFCSPEILETLIELY